MIVWESSRTWSILNIITLIVRGFLPLLQLYILKLVIDVVSKNISSSPGQDSVQNILVIILLAGGVYLLSTLLAELGMAINKVQVNLLTDHLYSLIHEQSTVLDLGYFENPDFYDIMQRAHREVAYRPQQLVNNISSIIQNGLSVAAISILLVTLHWAVVPVLFLAILPGVYIRIKFARIMFDWEHKNTPRNRLASYYNWLMTRDFHAKEIKLFELGDFLSGKYNELRDALRSERNGLVRKRLFAELPSQSIKVVAVFGSFAYLAYRTAMGLMTLGSFVMYLQAIRRGIDTLHGTMAGFVRVYENNLFVSNLFEFFDLSPQIKEEAEAVSLPGTEQLKIEFINVSFSYPSNSKIVLNNVNFSIFPGETIALTGLNGSGKSTIIKLLCRLYDPTSGNITINGIDIKQISLHSLRRLFSVHFQDSSKYFLSVNDNIRMSNVNSADSGEAVITAAKTAGADEFITQLPDSYNCILGNWFENGTELSVGQWQKLSLARAFYRDSQVIMLDEPTSAFDAESEHDFILKLPILLDDKTGIIVTHRFALFEQADRIIVLDSGEVAQIGTHHELMKDEGQYRQMIKSISNDNIVQTEEF